MTQYEAVEARLHDNSLAKKFFLPVLKKICVHTMTLWKTVLMRKDPQKQNAIVWAPGQ